MNSNYLNSIRIILLDYNYQRVDVQDVLSELNTFTNRLRNFKKIDKDVFIKENQIILSTIKIELEYLIKSNAQPQSLQALIRSRDQLFGSLLRNVVIENERRNVTKIYNEFTEGLTHFQNETIYDINLPSYHKDGSCSKKGSKNRECIQTNNIDSKNKKKNDIRKCYIERFIYDFLWTKLMFSSQDINHIERLGKTKEAYQTCYPEKELHIDIEFDEISNMPTKLIVFEDNVQEIYEKRYDNINKQYIYPVDCVKYENEIMKRKQSTFALDGVWS